MKGFIKLINKSALSRLFIFCSMLFSPIMVLAVPILFYSDLDSGPNSGGENGGGVYVTVYGKRLGTTGTVTVGGGVTTVKQWSDTKVTVQLGAASATGNIVLTNAEGTSNGLPFTVRSGRIFFVSPNGTGSGTVSNPASPYIIHSSMQPGDTYYFRAGDYSGIYGDGTWGYFNFTLGPNQSGTASNPLALIGYPGESVTLTAPEQRSRSNIIFSTAAGHGAYTTIANMILLGGTSCIESGGIWTSANSGAPGVRVVGITCSANYTNNTMTGLLAIANNGWRVWGNEFKDTGTTPPINNNHGIYVQVGSSDVDIGWNTFRNLRMGHVIQVHTDSAVINGGPPCYTFENVRIHHNVLTATNIDDSRGIVIGNACSGSYGSIYNNLLYNLGQDFSALVIFNGNWKVYNNTFYNIHSTYGILRIQDSASATADAKNNIFYSDGSSYYVTVLGIANMSQFTLANNLYYNRGNGPAQDATAINANPLFVNAGTSDFRLNTGSPAINSGSSDVSSVVTLDLDGYIRPMGPSYDIGVYEYIIQSVFPQILPPTNLRIID